MARESIDHSPHEVKSLRPPTQDILTASKILRQEITYVTNILLQGKSMTTRYPPDHTVTIPSSISGSSFTLFFKDFHTIALTREQRFSANEDQTKRITEELHAPRSTEFTPVKPLRTTRRGRGLSMNTSEYEKAYWKALRLILSQKEGKAILTEEDIRKAKQKASVAGYIHSNTEKYTEEPSSPSLDNASPGVLSTDDKEVIWEETKIPSEMRETNVNILLMRSFYGKYDDPEFIEAQTDILKTLGTWTYNKFAEAAKRITVQTLLADAREAGVNYAVTENFFFNKMRGKGGELLSDADLAIRRAGDYYRSFDDKSITIPIILVQQGVSLESIHLLQFVNNVSKIVQTAIQLYGNCTFLQIDREIPSLSEAIDIFQNKEGYKGLQNLNVSRNTTQEAVLAIIDNVLDTSRH